MNRHDRPRAPRRRPVVPEVLRRHGLAVVVIGWLTLLGAELCWLLVSPPVGAILGIVFTVLGAVKVWLAGKGTYEGVDANVYAGCDAIGVLETTLHDLGVNE